MQLQGTSRDHQLRVGLAIGIVVLTLMTAVLHYQIGGFTTLFGLLFYAAAASYAVLAAAFVAPLRLAEIVRPLTRLALLANAAGMIVGWYLFGGRYDMAYFTKGVEIALIALLVLDAYRDRASYRRLLDRARFQFRRQPAAA